MGLAMSIGVGIVIGYIFVKFLPVILGLSILAILTVLTIFICSLPTIIFGTWLAYNDLASIAILVGVINFVAVVANYDTIKKSLFGWL